MWSTNEWTRSTTVVVVLCLAVLLSPAYAKLSSRISAGTGCPLKYTHFNGFCYGVVKPMAAEVLPDQCQADGGELATWHNEETMLFITELLPMNVKCATGLQRSDTTWSWRNGEPMLVDINRYVDSNVKSSVDFWSLEKLDLSATQTPPKVVPSTNNDAMMCTICQTRRVNSIYHDAAVYYPMDVWSEGKTFDVISGSYLGESVDFSQVDLVESDEGLGRGLKPQSSDIQFALPPSSEPCDEESCYEAGTTVSFWVELPPSLEEEDLELGFTCLVRTDAVMDYSNYSFCKYSGNDAIMTTGSETWSLYQNIANSTSTTWTFVVASWAQDQFRGCVWPRDLSCFVCHSFTICEGCMDLVHDGPLHFGWDNVTFDEFAIWHRPLADEEIIRLFNRSEPRIILDSTDGILELLDLVMSHETLSIEAAQRILESELDFVRHDGNVDDVDDLLAVNSLLVETVARQDMTNDTNGYLLENLELALEIVSLLTNNTKETLWHERSHVTLNTVCACTLTQGVGQFAVEVALALQQKNMTERTVIVTAYRAAAQITPVDEITGGGEDNANDNANANDDTFVIELQTRASQDENNTEFSPSVQITIPISLLEQEETSLIVLVMYASVHDIFPGRENATDLDDDGTQTIGTAPSSSRFIASAIIDLTFLPKQNLSATFDHPIQIVFELQSRQFKEASRYDTFESKCVYWNELYKISDGLSGIWSTSGCERVAHNDTHVTCACYHLTHFAVLMIREPGNIGGSHLRALTILSNVGCSLSILGGVLTVVTFVMLRMHTDRVLIHMNLAASVAISQILFLAQGAITPMTIGCKVMAGIMYYFFMASFMWMLIEGLQLYTQVILVFNQENSKMKFYLLGGWVTPMILTAFVIGLTHQSIGNREDVCWLDYTDNSIWYFVVPALLIVVVNLIILTRVTVVIVTLKNHDQLRKDKALYQKIKYSIKASLTISPLMGSTWLFGVLTLAESSNLAFLYMFVLCNSIQGLLIFALHCLNSQEVRDVFMRRVEMYRIGRGIRRFRVRPHDPNSSQMGQEKSTQNTRSTINTVSSYVGRESKAE